MLSIGATVGVKTTMSYSARRYLDEALDVVQRHSVKRHVGSSLHVCASRHERQHSDAFQPNPAINYPITRLPNYQITQLPDPVLSN